MDQEQSSLAFEQEWAGHSLQVKPQNKEEISCFVGIASDDGCRQIEDGNKGWSLTSKSCGNKAVAEIPAVDTSDMDPSVRGSLTGRVKWLVRSHHKLGHGQCRDPHRDYSFHLK